MKRISAAAVFLLIVFALCACSAPSAPIKVSVTVDPTQPTPIPTATPESSATPSPSETPQPTEEPIETDYAGVNQEFPDFLEMSYEQISYEKGKTIIRLPVANISEKTAKGGLVFDIYLGDETKPKYTLPATLEEREEKVIYANETVTLIVTSATDLRNCMVHVRPDPDDPIKLVD